MNVRFRSPAHDERANGEEDGADHHRDQTRFGDDLAPGLDELFAVVALGPDVDDACDGDADEDCDEGDGAHHFVPVACLCHGSVYDARC